MKCEANVIVVNAHNLKHARNQRKLINCLSLRDIHKNSYQLTQTKMIKEMYTLNIQITYGHHTTTSSAPQWNYTKSPTAATVPTAYLSSTLSHYAPNIRLKSVTNHYV